MPSPAFTLEIVTPERTVFTGPVTTAVVPAEEGYLGILAHHAPLIATLTPGRITFRSPGGAMTTLQNEGAGFLEVRDNRVTVLADRVVPQGLPSVAA